ncbi:hypothetical protein LVJ83_05350 [Uruburuella testudinis]|uniref:Uncharacterized protein n=1 Tax=Uruburuella testudinis TaxID=1282863 RepID=A0ABY4DWM6_9NEIS|nr:hypothetical protein [Uruburuella testudinis]UOO82888.1 hypothetical protein LVJ83_05350 [Uruburuella testudinis]
MQIHQLELSTQAIPASAAVQFTLHRHNGRNEILGIYRPEDKLWLCPLAFPNQYAAPLVADHDLSSLRTILFLAGVDDIDGCITALVAYVREFNNERGRHAA